MEIIHNDADTVIRAEVVPPYGWKESDNRPEIKGFVCRIEALGESRTEMRLTLDELSRISELGCKVYFDVLYEWQTPTTSCCGKPRPREVTTLVWSLEQPRIYCKEGHGCKAKEAAPESTEVT